MESKKFKKYEKALVSDLSKVNKYSEYELGFFMGETTVNKIWMELDNKQFKILENHIKDTFSLKNFNLLGKRKTTLKT